MGKTYHDVTMKSKSQWLRLLKKVRNVREPKERYREKDIEVIREVQLKEEVDV